MCDLPFRGFYSSVIVILRVNRIIYNLHSKKVTDGLDGLHREDPDGLHLMI